MKLKIYKQLIFETYSPLVAYPQTISYTNNIWANVDYCVVNIISLKSNYCYWVDIGDMQIM
jgi:hypothetical protein